MKTIVLAFVTVLAAGAAFGAPPSELRPALEKWASPQSVGRYQFALIDLNRDGLLDAVVHLTDPDFCGNGGCPLVTFKRVGEGYELIGSSGFVRKPVYVLNEAHGGWHTLASVVGLGDGAGLVPIRFKEQVRAYRSMPYLNPHLDLKAADTLQALNFEETL